MPSGVRIRLGTRASALARWQAQWVSGRLAELGIEVVLVPITTSGDRQQTPFGAGSSPGAFTKEIQRGLLDDRIDLAVHSLKDLPTEEVPGLRLAAVPPRASVGDVLVCGKHASLEEVPPHAAVGTGSLRRRAQLRRVRPDLEMKDIRGNIDTRLRKLADGDYDALVLAEAGLRRLGLAEHITQLLPLDVLLPAVGQGALGLETRDDDQSTREAIEPLDDRATHASVEAERAMLSQLQGGCLAPIAAHGRVEGEAFTLSGRVISFDGSEMIETTLTGDMNDAAGLGCRVAEELISRGAAGLISAAREVL